MGKKIWEKKSTENLDHAAIIEKFTVGNDTDFDMLLAEFDVLGSLAHTKMLNSIGLISDEEWIILEKELNTILGEIELGKFQIEEGIEDIHSQIEFMLTQRIGEIGKKIHSGRSRNDQVLTDLKLLDNGKLTYAALILLAKSNRLPSPPSSMDADLDKA